MGVGAREYLLVKMLLKVGMDGDGYTGAYEGEMEKQERHGHGKCLYANNNTYDGQVTRMRIILGIAC
jgi:hypothetical protein